MYRIVVSCTGVDSRIESAYDATGNELEARCCASSGSMTTTLSGATARRGYRTLAEFGKMCPRANCAAAVLGHICNS
ncbi:MAG: hypothetical protein C4296_14520 [Gemmataceae bacterium]